MLRAHVDAEEWGVALQLAKRHGLDPDQVHKARWLAAPPSREALSDSLAKVSDRAWAAAQCAAAVVGLYKLNLQVESSLPIARKRMVPTLEPIK
jgi:hypothetical protein